jgi:hypothetical protein
MGKNNVYASVSKIIGLMRIFMHQICAIMTLDALIDSFLVLLNLQLP